MSRGAMSFKALIRNLAKKKNVKPQILLQNYMFECFLERLSLSEYKNIFALKGGMFHVQQQLFVYNILSIIMVSPFLLWANNNFFLTFQRKTHFTRMVK